MDQLNNNIFHTSSSKPTLPGSTCLILDDLWTQEKGW